MFSPFGFMGTQAGGGGNDPDAQAFINATGISGIEATAINTLVLDLKGYSIWTKLKVIYPMVGGTATTMKYNLRDPQDTDAAYRIDWVGSNTTFNSDGVTFPANVADYGKTYINLSGSTDFSIETGSIAVYNRGYDPTIGTNAAVIGFRSLASPTLNCQIFINSGSFNSISNWQGAGASSVGALSGNNGLLMTCRTGSTSIENYRNGVLEISNSGSAGALINSVRDIQMLIGAHNRTSTPGAVIPGFPTSANVAFASVGDGLDNTEGANLYTAVQAFQTTLSRQV